MHWIQQCEQKSGEVARILEIYVCILTLNQIAIFELDIYLVKIFISACELTLDSCRKYIMKYELYLISTIEFIISVNVALLLFFLCCFFQCFFLFSFFVFLWTIFLSESIRFIQFTWYCFWCCISCFIIDVLWYGLFSAFFSLFFCCVFFLLLALKLIVSSMIPYWSTIEFCCFDKNRLFSDNINSFMWLHLRNTSNSISIFSIS